MINILYAIMFCLGLLIVIISSLRLRYHIDRILVLNTDDMSKLFKNGIPPRCVLTKRGKIIFNIYIGGFALMALSMLALSLSGAFHDNSKISSTDKFTNRDCLESTNSVCSEYLKNGDPSKCTINEIENLLTPKSGIHLSSIDRYYRQKPQCRFFPCGNVCFYHISDGFGVQAIYNIDTVADGHLTTHFSCVNTIDSAEEIVRQLDDSSYKLLLSGILMKYGKNGVNFINIDSIGQETKKN